MLQVQRVQPTCATNGVLLRDPRKPEPPAVAQLSVTLAVRNSHDRIVGMDVSDTVRNLLLNFFTRSIRTWLSHLRFPILVICYRRIGFVGLTSTSIRFRTLSTYWKTTTANTVATQVHQTLNIHLYFTT